MAPEAIVEESENCTGEPRQMFSAPKLAIGAGDITIVLETESKHFPIVVTVRCTW